MILKKPVPLHTRLEQAISVIIDKMVLQNIFLQNTSDKPSHKPLARVVKQNPE